MSKGNELFELIKSLTPSEKRSFRLATSGYQTEKSYLKLFDEIDKQTEYDEERLRKKMAIKSQANFSMVKNYLKELILENMEGTRAKTSLDVLLNKYLNRIIFLIDKGLSAQAKKLLAQTKELAVKGEKFTILVMVYDLETRLLLNATSGESVKEELLRLDADAKRVIKQLDNYWEFLFQSSYYTDSVRGDYFIEEKIAELYSLGKGLFNDEASALSKQSLRLFHLGWSLRYAYSSNYPKLEESQKKILAVEFEIEDANMFKVKIICIANILVCLYSQRKLEEMHSYIEKLEYFNNNMPTYANAQCHALVVVFLANFKIKVAVRSGNTDVLNASIQELANGVKKHKDKVPRVTLASTTAYLAIAYFFIGQFKESKKILAKADVFEWKVFGLQVRILKCMTYYELDQRDLLKRESASALRVIAKEEDGAFHAPFEKLFLSFFRNLNSFVSKAETAREFSRLKTKVDQLDPNETNEDPFYKDFFLDWIAKSSQV